MSWLVLVNPHAGSTSPPTGEIRRLLQSRNVSHTLVETATVAAAHAAVNESVADGTSRFAVVGGDGSAHALINAVMAHRWESRPTLAVLPAGTGADLTRTFALSRSLSDSIGLLDKGEAYTMDVGLIQFGDGNSRWFLNVVDIGIAAAAVKTARRIPRRIGGVRYTAAFWLTLPRFRPRRVVVSTERRTVAEVALNVVVANGQFFGGGLNIAPQAAISDGLLDVEVFLGPRVRAFGVMPRVIRGLHLRHPAVKTMRAERFDIEVPAGWPVEADGELVGFGPLIASVIPAAVDLMI